MYININGVIIHAAYLQIGIQAIEPRSRVVEEDIYI